MAFAMGQEERLGAFLFSVPTPDLACPEWLQGRSFVRALDPGVLRMILDPESCEGV